MQNLQRQLSELLDIYLNNSFFVKEAFSNRKEDNLQLPFLYFQNTSEGIIKGCEFKGNEIGIEVKGKSHLKVEKSVFVEHKRSKYLAEKSVYSQGLVSLSWNSFETDWNTFAAELGNFNIFDFS